jgi:ethanolamine utilization protein EutA
LTHDHHHHHHDDDFVYITDDGIEEPAAYDPDEAPVDQVRLTTVGIDIGSATAHFLLSRITLRRLGQAMMSRFEVVNKEELYRSGIAFTPYRSATEIDADALSAFFDDHFARSGVSHDELDTGIVMLTGEAARKTNARAIAALFAGSMGKFVCTSAGHLLEARMAANGSGAVAQSREQESTLVNVDMGGGTTKFTLIHAGEIVGSAALNVGGRLVAIENGVVARIDEAARIVAAEAGISLTLGEALADADRRRLCAGLADCVVEYLTKSPADFSELTNRLLLTEPLDGLSDVSDVVMSGGVAEYLTDPGEDAADLGPTLAAELASRLALAGRQVQPAPERMRATVVGLSQFTTQLSGDTVWVSSERATPQRNLPVVPVSLRHLGEEPTAERVTDAVRDGLTASGREDLLDPVAISLEWEGRPYYRTLSAIAQGLATAARTVLPDGPLVVTLTQDCARSLGTALAEAVGAEREFVCVDGLHLSENDFIDVGDPIQNGRVVPVVVKTLVFPETRAEALAGRTGRFVEVGGQLL